MKKGDLLPVTIQGVTVTQAVVEAVESDRVTLLVPGVRAVVGIRTYLSEENPNVPEKETIIDGVVTPDNSSDGTEAPTAAPEATVEATPEAEPVAESPVEVEVTEAAE